jgi:translocation and assembly module TamA
MRLITAACVVLLAIAATAFDPQAARAQAPQPSAEALLDPESPMDALPGLGVDWPDMNDASAVLATPDLAAVSDDNGERRYSVIIEGVEESKRDKLMARFDLLSTLRAGENKPANAAQIDRRAREDAALFESLLRAEGYYDADVEARVEAAEQISGEAGRLTVRLTAEPGTLYRFSDVTVTGLDGSDATEATLREGFTVAEADAVDADIVITDRAKLDASLKGSGYPFAMIRKPRRWQ